MKALAALISAKDEELMASIANVLEDVTHGRLLVSMDSWQLGPPWQCQRQPLDSRQPRYQMHLPCQGIDSLGASFNPREQLIDCLSWYNSSSDYQTSARHMRASYCSRYVTPVVARFFLYSERAGVEGSLPDTLL